MTNEVHLTFDDQIKKIEKIIEDARNEAKAAFVAELRRLMTLYPEIKCAVWNQYTPSFNDGDPCYFTVGDFYISTSEEVDSNGEIDTEDDDHEVWSSYNLPPRFKEYQPVMDFMNSGVGADILEDVFGSDVQVRVTVSGVQVEDYDCGY
jgi:Zn-finger protein